MTTKLSDKQQQAMMYLEQSRAAGVTLSQHLRAQGVELRPMYDALAALRRKGVLATASAKSKRSASAFVAVRVAAPAPTRSAMVCRVLLGGVAVMECGEWPPPAWLSALLGPRADAAA
jgi:hypothetical protein